MFFQGSLQDGISTAVQQAKQVVCFVTGKYSQNAFLASRNITDVCKDEGDESQQWEDEFLTEASVQGPLQSNSIALRLVAGSEEAGFLEALFPVPRKPTLVVIQYVLITQVSFIAKFVENHYD